MRNQTPPLAPSEQASAVHIVLDDFGRKLGRAYRETDENAADAASIIEKILNGEYSHPLRVVAFNLTEGGARDVSDEIANRLLDLSAEGRMLSASARDFVERVIGREVVVVI